MLHKAGLDMRTLLSQVITIRCHNRLKEVEGSKLNNIRFFLLNFFFYLLQDLLRLRTCLNMIYFHNNPVLFWEGRYRRSFFNFSLFLKMRFFLNLFSSIFSLIVFVFLLPISCLLQRLRFLLAFDVVLTVPGAFVLFYSDVIYSSVLFVRKLGETLKTYSECEIKKIKGFYHQL